MDKINDFLTTLGAMFVVLTIIFGLVLLISYITMLLWNYVMPSLGLPSLDIWKMAALLILIRFIIPRIKTNTSERK